jgi:DNA-binding MarR family transcriptional regulator
MRETLLEQLAALNQAYKEIDDAYHNYALSHGISDMTFWILYFIGVHEGIFTQRELCDEWYFAPQTVNSALKGLEKKGIVELTLAPDSRRNKQIRLTSAGKEMLERIIVPLLEAEERSFGRLEEQEREQLLSLTRKHIDLLKAEAEKIQ